MLLLLIVVVVVVAKREEKDRLTGSVKRKQTREKKKRKQREREKDRKRNKKTSKHKKKMIDLQKHIFSICYLLSFFHINKIIEKRYLENGLLCPA